MAMILEGKLERTYKPHYRYQNCIRYLLKINCRGVVAKIAIFACFQYYVSFGGVGVKNS